MDIRKTTVMALIAALLLVALGVAMALRDIGRITKEKSRVRGQNDIVAAMERYKEKHDMLPARLSDAFDGMAPMFGYHRPWHYIRETIEGREYGITYGFRSEVPTVPPTQAELATLISAGKNVAVLDLHVVVIVQSPASAHTKPSVPSPPCSDQHGR